MRLRTTDVLLAMSAMLALFLGVTTALADPAEAADAAREEARAEAAGVSPYMRAVSEKRSQEQASERVVFSNDDLERRYGPPPEPKPSEVDAAVSGEETVPPPSKPEAVDSAEPEAVESGEPAVAEPSAEEGAGEAVAEAPADPLQQLADEQAQAAERGGQLTEAERKVEEARIRISELERRMLALRNPLLPRPAPPKEGREEWDRSGTSGRVELSQTELSRARMKLVEAEQELARVRSEP